MEAWAGLDLAGPQGHGNTLDFILEELESWGLKSGKWRDVTEKEGFGCYGGRGGCETSSG